MVLPPKVMLLIYCELNVFATGIDPFPRFTEACLPRKYRFVSNVAEFLVGRGSCVLWT